MWEMEFLAFSTKVGYLKALLTREAANGISFAQVSSTEWIPIGRVSESEFLFGE